MPRLVGWLGVNLACVQLLFIACQTRELHHQKEVRRNPSPYQLDTPFQLADPSCTRDRTVDDFGQVYVWVLHKSWPAKLSYHLNGYSGRGLGSDTIASVKIKNVFRRKGGSLLLENPGQDIYLCRGEGEYPVDSLENIALSAAVSINAVNQLLLANNYRLLPKVTIYLHPQLDGSMNENERFDNAFYLNNSIFILPHTKRALERDYKGVPLWGQLAVISHEYGHMVLDTITKRAYNREILQGKETLPLEEGFADLVAYYSHGGATSTLGQLRFGDVVHNRNVATCSCDDGTFKVLSRRFLDRYFGGLGLLGPSPDPTDAHALGAIIAYGFEQLLQNARPSAGGKEGMAVLLSWGKKLSALQRSSLQGERLLERAIFRGIESLRERYGSLGPANCDVLSTTFPAFYPTWRRELEECRSVNLKEAV
jgi:hypothetical protein